MRPFTIYHLSRDENAQQRLVDIIVKAAQPDMILLLGASLYRRRSESIFQPSAPTSQHIANYFLLVLMQNLSGAAPHEWQDKIETHCKVVMPVTAIVLQKSHFEQWLNEGHRFAIHVQQSAAVMYTSGSYHLPVATTANDDASTNAIEKQLTEGLTKAEAFLAGAELFSIRKQYAMAAFMLHQSAEQALRTLLSVSTGYLAHTHSIDRLLRYAGLVSYQLPDIFPGNTEKEKQLLRVLQDAYVASRYKEAYSVTHEDVYTLTTRIKTLIAIAAISGRQAITAHTQLLTTV